MPTTATDAEERVPTTRFTDASLATLLHRRLLQHGRLHGGACAYGLCPLGCIKQKDWFQKLIVKNYWCMDLPLEHH